MKPINMIMIYYWNKKLRKRLHVLEVNVITIKKTSIWCFLLKGYIFLEDVLQMTAIELFTVIDYYHYGDLWMCRQPPAFPYNALGFLNDNLTQSISVRKTTYILYTYITHNYKARQSIPNYKRDTKAVPQNK